jgi:hypothetical protein
MVCCLCCAVQRWLQLTISKHRVGSSSSSQVIEQSGFCCKGVTDLSGHQIACYPVMEQAVARAGLVAWLCHSCGLPVNHVCVVIMLQA